jgi:hypothetical protein
MSRYPSRLISWVQLDPDGGLSAGDEGGSMKPAGAERVYELNEGPDAKKSSDRNAFPAGDVGWANPSVILCEGSRSPVWRPSSRQAGSSGRRGRQRPFQLLRRSFNLCRSLRRGDQQLRGPLPGVAGLIILGQMIYYERSGVIERPHDRAVPYGNGAGELG